MHIVYNKVQILHQLFAYSFPGYKAIGEYDRLEYDWKESQRMTTTVIKKPLWVKPPLTYLLLFMLSCFCRVWYKFNRSNLLSITTKSIVLWRSWSYCDEADATNQRRPSPKTAVSEDATHIVIWRWTRANCLCLVASLGFGTNSTGPIY